jgi:ribonucleoside-diphosphate reductase alpha chain
MASFFLIILASISNSKPLSDLSQASIVELAADRTQYVCQSQSLNIFLPSITSKKILHQVHYVGWKLGIKSFYYLRSRSVGRGENIGNMNQKAEHSFEILEENECLACQ